VVTAGQNDHLHVMLHALQSFHQVQSVYFWQSGIKQCDPERSEAGRLERLTRVMNGDYLIASLNKPASQCITLLRVIFDNQ
jgi:hypothetical protein